MANITVSVSVTWDRLWWSGRFLMLGTRDVLVIFRKTKKEGQGNYRQVSLPSVPGKVMEQILLEAISKHLKDEERTGNIWCEFNKSKLCSLNAF